VSSPENLTAWRITKRKHIRSAFTGEGAQRYGGRWTSPGTAVIYTAQSQSLAALEMLVHLDSADLLDRYALFEVVIKESLIRNTDPEKLPRNWKRNPPPAPLQAIGDSWALTKSSAVLRVPSALVPGEDNFLLNPAHPDFRELRIGKPLAFHFDPRLTTRL